MLKNQSINFELRRKLESLFGDEITLSRRVKKWVAKDFGVSLFGINFKFTANGNSNINSSALKNISYFRYKIKQNLSFTTTKK